MRFTCQQSGHCCCDPNIIVTLTFRDVYRLFSIFDSNFEKLIQKITFYTLDSISNNKILKQMVLKPIQTSQGKIIPGLRKFEGSTCIFYNRPNCSIYPNRPLACKNYPFAFTQENSNIIVNWVKHSTKTCPGIGKGNSISYEKIKNQGRNCFNEIESHNKIIDNLNLEAVQGRPLTAREALWILVIYSEKNSQK